MDWFNFALGFTSCGFLFASGIMFYLIGDKKKSKFDEVEFNNVEFIGPCSPSDIIKEMETLTKETKDDKGTTTKSTKVSKIKPKS